MPETGNRIDAQFNCKCPGVRPGALPQATVVMAYGQLRVAWCGFWGVAPGYGGYGLRPIARGVVWVLGRCPRLRWLWPTANCAWRGVGSGALPQATVVMAFGQLRVVFFLTDLQFCFIATPAESTARGRERAAERHAARTDSRHRSRVRTE